MTVEVSNVLLLLDVAGNPSGNITPVNMIIISWEVHLFIDDASYPLGTYLE